MNYRTTITPDGTIAIFCWTGPITIEQRTQMRKEMLEFCREKGIRKVIVDTREQTYDTSTLKLFTFAEEIPRLMPHSLLAIVRKPEDRDMKFVDDVAANRGAQVRSFTDLPDAQRWLESVEVPPAKPGAGSR